MSLSSQPEESENDTGASGGGNMVYLKYKDIMQTKLCVSTDLLTNK